MEAQAGWESKTVTDEAFRKKGGLFPNFLFIFFVVYFFPCYPSPPFVPTSPSSLCVCATVADCLESIKMVVGR